MIQYCEDTFFFFTLQLLKKNLSYAMHFLLLPNYTYTCPPSGKENPMKRTCLNGVFGEWKDGSFIPDSDQDQYCKAFNLPLSQSSECQVDSQQFVYSDVNQGKIRQICETANPVPTPTVETLPNTLPLP